MLKSKIIILSIVGVVILGLFGLGLLGYYVKSREEQKNRQHINLLKEKGVFDETTFTVKKGEEVIETPYIGITGKTVAPEVVEVRLGDLVIFRNEDYKNHWIQFVDSPEEDIIKPGESYTRIFFSPGEFRYLIDKVLTGKIIIKQ